MAKVASHVNHTVVNNAPTVSNGVANHEPTKIADLMAILEASVESARSSAPHSQQVLRFGPWAGQTVAEMNSTLHENCAQWPVCTSCDGSEPSIEDIHCAESDAKDHERLWITSGSTGADFFFASHSEAGAVRQFAEWITQGFSADLYYVKPKAVRKVLRNPEINDKPLIVGSLVEGTSEAADLLFHLVEMGKEVLTVNQ